MAAMVELSQSKARSWEPVASSSLSYTHGAQGFGLSSAAFPIHKQVVGSEMVQLRLELDP